MKTCPYCKIEVGGDFSYCPLCQNQLIGTETPKYWPAPQELKKRSKIYKIQLFIVLSAIIACLFLDLWADESRTLSWSPLVIIWLIIGEITFSSIFSEHHYVAAIISRIAMGGIAVLLITSFWYPVLIAIIPIPLIGLIVMNFISILIDKNNSAVVYFLCNLGTVLISWLVVIVLLKYDLALLWQICLLASLISIIGTIIFRGRTLFTELKKRFNV